MGALLKIVEPKLLDLTIGNSQPKVEIEYSIEAVTFLDKKPIYQQINKSFNISIDIFDARNSFVNFSGNTYSDRKYKLVQNNILNYGQFIVSDSDLLAHDAYIENINNDEYSQTLVILYFSNVYGSPSKKRVKRAFNKLSENGINVKYFATKKSAEKYCKSLLNKKAIK